MTTKQKKAKFNKDSKGLWRALAKARANNVCEFCHNPHPTLNVHHIVGKGRCRILRWDLANALVLCPTHHTFGEISAHSKDYFGLVVFTEWLDKYLAKSRKEYLKNRKYKMEKQTIDFLEKEYAKLLKEEKMMAEMSESNLTSYNGILTGLVS